MPVTVFRTARLHCRRWELADLDAVVSVYTDPVAMRWVGDGNPITPERCKEWLAVTSRNYARRGYGMFALESHNSGLVVGFCGLVHPGDQEEPEIKYALHPAHWGQGYASEVVPTLLAYGVSEHGMKSVMATVSEENLASQRVLTKAGMRLSHRRVNDNGSVTLVLTWSLQNAA